MRVRLPVRRSLRVLGLAVATACAIAFTALPTGAATCMCPPVECEIGTGTACSVECPREEDLACDCSARCEPTEDGRRQVVGENLCQCSAAGAIGDPPSEPAIGPAIE